MKGGISVIKIDVITGFLGAGKTTFLKRLMSEKVFEDEKVIIIENEFGEVPIDNTILEDEAYTLVEISGGCICCSLKGDFIEALNEIAKKEQPDRILIEPSGVFVIEDIFAIIDSPYLSGDYTLDSIITVIDIRHYNMERLRYIPFFDSQIKYANHIVISKVSDHSDDEIDGVIQDIRGHNQKASVHALLVEQWKADDLILLFTKGYERPTTIEQKIDHNTSHRIESISIKKVKNFDGEKLTKVLGKLESGIYGQVLRLKGYVKVDEQVLLVNYVNGDVGLEVVDYMEPVLTIIGSELDKPKIRQLLTKLNMKFT